MAQNVTYTWNGSTSSNWSTSANWNSSLIAPTNGTFAGTRLTVANNAGSELIYDAANGTTVYSNTVNRALVIGSLATGRMRITGGTFSTAGSSFATDVLANDGVGTLMVEGGNFISPLLSLGISGGGVGLLIVSNTGTATITKLTYNTTQSGTVELGGGTLTVSNIIFSSSGLKLFNFNGGTLKPFNSSAAFFPGGLTRANVRNGGAIIDTDTNSVTIAPPLLHSTNVADAAIDGGLTKNGNGTLTLSGVPTYTGPTRVNGGRLITPLPTASSSLVLAAGTRFSPTLTNLALLADSAAFTNTTVDFNYGSFSANPITNAALYITNLALSGSVTCNIVGTGFPVTNLTLVSYGSKTGGGAFVLGSLPTGMAATFNDDGANVTLNITAPSIQSLIWSTGDGTWKTNGAANWNSGTATYLEYLSGVNDAVTFDDTASGTVTITGQVNPSATTVNITSSSYTFSGAGSIGGTNGITKQGTGTLQIDNANNFTGPCTISGGTLFVNNNSALGATNGTVTVNGPANTLEIGIPGGSGIAVNNKTVVINGTGVGGSRGALRGAAVAAGQTNIWAGPVILGADTSRIGTEDNGNLVIAGSITDNGANYGVLLRPGTSGTVIIASTNNSYAFTQTFGDATTSYIMLGANNALAASPLYLGPGFLDLNGFNQTVAGINHSFGGGTIINNGTSTVTLTINTGTNIAGAFFFSSGLMDGTSSFNIVKSGKGSQTLSGANVTYSGTTTISGGQLDLSSTNLMNTAITVQADGTLGGEGATTNSLTFQANSTLAFDPSTAGSFTANTIDATVSPIKVSFTTAAPTNTDSLVLNAPNGITGSAANFQIVGSPSGMFYFTNGNTQLMFAPTTINTNPPNLSYSVVPGVLSLSWPTNAGWILQAQTNSRSVGLSTNWVDVSGSSSITSTNIMVQPDNPTVFYRLRLP